MNIDVELLLLALTGLTFIGYLVDRFAFESERRQNLHAAQVANPSLSKAEKEQILNSGGIFHMLRSLFPVFLLVLVIRSFLFEPFTIPSSSMEPTLYPGDFVVVNKFHYGIRLPGIRLKVIPNNDPERGDVIVFRFPRDEKTNYIKRVIGLPGDKIRYDSAKNVYINGERVPVENWGGVKSAARTSEDLTEMMVKGREGTAALPRGEETYKHQIRIDPSRPAIMPGFSDAIGETIPEGHYLVFGDNRDHSSDSRYWGLVEDRLIVGKAEAIWMHWQDWIPSFARNGWI